VAGVVVVGAALPAALAIANRIPGGSWNRQPWDSTLYGGSLTDLLLPSPWLSRLSLGGEISAGAISGNELRRHRDRNSRAGRGR